MAQNGEAARRTRSVAEQLSGAGDRQCVICCALRVEQQAVRLEQLADWLSDTESKGGTPRRVATVADIAGPELPQGAVDRLPRPRLPD